MRLPVSELSAKFMQYHLARDNSKYLLWYTCFQRMNQYHHSMHLGDVIRKKNKWVHNGIDIPSHVNKW